MLSNRERNRLLTVADSLLDGARQLPYLEPASVQRMGRDILDGVTMIEAPAYMDARQAIAGTVRSLLNAPASGTSEATASALNDQLRALRRRLTADTDVTYTVVFMPYNASMWDSLHTVWAAAQADPRVEAIVVPIPFASLSPDGSVSEWHDHSRDLPAEVPVTPVTEFDLGRTHPDVIYIHNPYDDRNRVTRVDPRFYSAELRRHTGMLVYIPYYVSPSPPDEHLYSFPSFNRFDKVFVQSETIDQGVIEKWSSNTVVPLGSPKFDYVLTRGSPMPARWARQADRHTVLLQLTSFATLVNDPEPVVRKLQDVLDVVEASDDLTLWWRPHPLERETVTSMLPELQAAYCAYWERAERSDRVILDTSPDLQRAIHNADAYYGHWSSVTELFGLTGKPMVIQGVNVETNVPRPEGSPGDGPVDVLTVYARPEWLIDEGAIDRLRRLVRETGGQVPGQREYFATLTAHADGTAGQHIHDYVMSCLTDR